MSVFYKGFFDAFVSRVNLPDKKRKFIELYLYAQGIIYSNYIRSLKSALQDLLLPPELQKSEGLDLVGKIELMNELGIIDYLKARYAGTDSVSLENKIVEILCLITGVYSGQIPNGTTRRIQPDFISKPWNSLQENKKGIL